jgi:hypothetical protein
MLLFSVGELSTGIVTFSTFQEVLETRILSFASGDMKVL